MHILPLLSLTVVIQLAHLAFAWLADQYPATAKPGAHAHRVRPVLALVPARLQAQFSELASRSRSAERRPPTVALPDGDFRRQLTVLAPQPRCSFARRGVAPRECWESATSRSSTCC